MVRDAVRERLWCVLQADPKTSSCVCERERRERERERERERAGECEGEREREKKEEESASHPNTAKSCRLCVCVCVCVACVCVCEVCVHPTLQNQMESASCPSTANSWRSWLQDSAVTVQSDSGSASCFGHPTAKYILQPLKQRQVQPAESTSCS